MATTTDTDRAEIEQTLLRAGIYVLTGTPARTNALGGSRGIHVQDGEDGGFILTPYHPSPEMLMTMYDLVQLAFREAGSWLVVGTLRPEGPGMMPALSLWR